MLLTGFFSRYPLSRQALVVLHDVSAVVVALPLAIMLRDNALLTGDRLTSILTCLPLLAIAAAAAMLLLGSYRPIWRHMGVGEIIRVGQFATVAIFLFWFGQLFVDRLVELPRSAPVIQFLVAMFFLVGSRIVYSEYARWRELASRAQNSRQPVLLIGSGDGTAHFIEMLTRHSDAAYEPVGILSDKVTRHSSIKGVPVLGSLADIDQVLANLGVQCMTPARLIVTGPHHEVGLDAAQHVMQRAQVVGIPVEQLHDLMGFEHKSLPQEKRYLPAILEAIPTSLYPRVKRLFDVAVSAIGLVLLSPLMALAAVAVAACIQRPFLFVQIRQGLHRRPFRLLKFRTMKDPLDAAGRLLDATERTPWVGRLLRRTRLDELPQFWNVLVGDMAIIGPRPLVVADLAAMPDGGRARARTRPGITGWAQVNGGHQLTPDEKLALDLWYTANASLALDARIVWRTVVMMLMGERRSPTAIALAFATLPAVHGEGRRMSHNRTSAPLDSSSAKRSSPMGHAA